METTELTPPWQLSDEELTARLLASETDLRRFYARVLDLVEEFERRKLGPGLGTRSTALFLERIMFLSRREAARRVRHATTDMPLARQAAREGDLSAEHLDEIEKTLSQTPSWLTPENRAEDEKMLIGLAKMATPISVAKVGQRLRSYWDIEGKDRRDREGELARPRREARYWFTRSGRFRLTADLDGNAGKVIAAALDTLAKPDAADELGNPDPRSREQRLGDAVVQVFDTATRSPRMPSRAGEQAVVMVTVTLEELQRRAAAAHLTDWGAASASELLKMCCDALLVPAVMNTKGEVLHLGRSRRHASRAQRHALAIRDKGCTRPGCTRGPKWCIPHHADHWIGDSGPTDLNNLALVCERDHNLIHHGGWDLEIKDGTVWWTPPAYLDPHRTPAKNTAHDPPPRYADNPVCA
ncbi:DUF222 domain-containing protein [Amycolatopsis sp. cg5]|uniref:HNH endonuclease signature motif containing protein n=1 Tax=Amycolatopsis sp. cg5 TaxID=3238802 RepID=UPI0035262ED4